MADEADAQETTTESVADTTAVEQSSASDTTDIGGDVQATDTGTASDEADKPAVDPEIARLNREVDKLRKEAAANRVKGNEKAETAAQEAAKKATEDLVSKLGKQLGLIADDAEPDPAALLKAAEDQKAEVARERDTYATKLRDYARKDALTEAAKTAEGDLDSILDSRKIATEIEKLDTTADDFSAQVAEIVSAAVQANPKLKKVSAQAAAPRSGGDMSGGNAFPNKPGDKDIDSYRRDFRKQRGFAD